MLVHTTRTCSNDVRAALWKSAAATGCALRGERPFSPRPGTVRLTGMHVHPCCRLAPASDKRNDFLQDLRHWHIHDLDIHPSGITLITSMICSWICGTAPGAPVKHHTPEQARSCFSCTLLGYSSTRLASQQRDDQVHQAHLLRQRCTMSF